MDAATRERLRTATSAVLAVALVLGVAGLVAFVVLPIPATTEYTEFYMLNESGVAAGYPSDLSVGEEGTVILGIESHQHEPTTYRVVAVVQGTDRRVFETRVDLERGESWEGEVSFSFREPGQRQVTFLLYLEREDVLHRVLYHQVNVTAAGSE